jgi:hypothetical protein
MGESFIEWVVFRKSRFQNLRGNIMALKRLSQ